MDNVELPQELVNASVDQLREALKAKRAEANRPKNLERAKARMETVSTTKVAELKKAVRETSDPAELAKVCSGYSQAFYNANKRVSSLSGDSSE